MKDEVRDDASKDVSKWLFFSTRDPGLRAFSHAHRDISFHPFQLPSTRLPSRRSLIKLEGREQAGVSSAAAGD